jgi:cytochrome c
MKPSMMAAVAILLLCCSTATARAQAGNVNAGQRAFGLCAACHSLQPNHNMTGPSLADVWGRKAGTLPDFHRYSPALKNSGIMWNDKTLDEWIENPQHLVPGNTMTFPGIDNKQQRTDLLAYLKEVTKLGHAPQTAQQGGSGMGGMGGAASFPNLKQLDPEDSVQQIEYCGDTYKVTTADGKTHDFWERNLRFKTDSSKDGPEKNAPALTGAGMMGDRADVIFANPEEISSAVVRKCE